MDTKNQNEKSHEYQEPNATIVFDTCAAALSESISASSCSSIWTTRVMSFARVPLIDLPSWIEFWTPQDPLSKATSDQLDQTEHIHSKFITQEVHTNDLEMQPVHRI